MLEYPALGCRGQQKTSHARDRWVAAWRVQVRGWGVRGPQPRLHCHARDAQDGQTVSQALQGEPSTVLRTHVRENLPCFPRVACRRSTEGWEPRSGPGDARSCCYAQCLPLQLHRSGERRCSVSAGASFNNLSSPSTACLQCQARVRSAI
jgi:hypothetical protein